MPTINPFYRFAPAYSNAGFSPWIEAYSDRLEELFNIVDAVDWDGTNIKDTLKEIRQEVNQFNTDLFTSFELVWPTPRPTFSGSFTAVFLIQDPVMVAGNPDQKITLTFNVVDDVDIDSHTIQYDGPIGGTGIFAPSFVPVESKVIQALKVYGQNGAAFFPSSYKLTGNIAISGLARGRNWTIDADGNPEPETPITDPFQPYRRIELDPLTADEVYIVTLMDKIIQEGLNGADIDGLEAFADALTWPDDYTCVVTKNEATFDRIEFCIENQDGNGFNLIGRYADGKWLFQRFVNRSGQTIQGDFFSNYLNTDPLPYESLMGKYLYTDVYDFDFCEFEPCEAPAEIYPMPIKPGDELQFNIPIDSGNFYGLTQCDVGLFTASGAFVQKIGEALFPDCISPEFTIIIPGADEATLRFEIGDFGWDVIFPVYNCTGEVVNTYATIPNASIDVSTTTNFAQSIVNYLNGLPNTVASFTISANLEFNIQILNTIVSVSRMDFLTDSLESPAYDYQSNTVISCPSPNQFDASVTIPSKEAGCYRYGLYYTDTYGQVLLSLSNALYLDPADCYSTILEYWSGDNTIAEGFEYFGDWKQRVRMGMNGGGEKQVIEENLYRQSNGVHRRPQNKQDLSLDLHTDYIDLPTQKALTDATRHPYLVWENQPIIVTGEIDVATVQDFTRQTSFEALSQMKFQALYQGYQPNNNNCVSC